MPRLMDGRSQRCRKVPILVLIQISLQFSGAVLLFVLGLLLYDFRGFFWEIALLAFIVGIIAFFISRLNASDAQHSADVESKKRYDAALKAYNLSVEQDRLRVCGRLMCCLKNEEETYEYLNSRLPNVGDYVTTDDGLKGEVSSVSVLRQMVKVLVEVDDEKEIRDYSVDQLKFKPKRRRDHVKLTAQELKELSALDDGDGG